MLLTRDRSRLDKRIVCCVRRRTVDYHAQHTITFNVLAPWMKWSVIGTSQAIIFNGEEGAEGWGVSW